MWNLKCCAKFSRFLIPLVLISVFQKSLSAKKGYYTIIAPAVVRPESAFHISFSLNDFPKSCWFNISLTSYPEHKQIYGLEGIEVKPGSTKLVELHAPSFNNTYGFLEIFGYRGIISKESELVFWENEKFWAFVQTDKVKYKPGELIKFRIISIDQLKRPAKFNEDISVEIYDSESNTIKLIRDVKFIKGVFRGELQISEYPNLGRWRMKVSIGNRYLTHKDFEVVRYVLPKFNVVLNYPKEVWMKDNQTILEVNANYFYGEPVKGNLSVMVTSMLVPYPETIQTTTKQYRIDGKSTIILDFKEDLHVISQDVPKIPSMEMYTFHIEALVTEDLSEEQSRADIEIGIWTKPYKLEFQTDKNFKSDEIISIKAKLLIRDLNENLITNPEQPIEIIIECSEKSFQEIGYAKQKTIHVEYKNEIGKDFAIIKFKNKNYTECYMFAEYEDCISLRSFSKIRPTLFEMDILTESPQEGKELETKLKNPEPFKEFSYEIVSRGDIVKSGFVQVPGNETTHILRFNVTSAMVPKITIYAHIIQNKNFVGQLKDILIKSAFPNSIELETENEVKPGESVYVNVTTDEGSYVGLMGVDPSALQSRERTGIFNEENVDWDLGSVNFIKSYYHTPFYYRTPEIITFSNALPPGYGGGQEPIGPTVPPKRIRKLFPESWLFLDFEKTPEEGLQILETAPDSITSWAITGFSINPESGLTFTKNTTNLRVFQEFFVLMDLPGLVKDGEIIEVPIYISNYLNQDALTTITIKSDSEDLLILEKSEDDSKSKQNISKLVEANKKDKILVFMKALKPGHYNVTVEAVSPVGSDAVQKTLNVQSQGIPYAMSKTFLVHLPKEGEQKGKIIIDIPENAVRGSERVEVSVVGDIFRPLMAKLEKLARVPYGNSEDNMRLIVSNSIVLKYLKVLNYSIPSLEKKILENIELGYQNQMSFKYLDGSFGLFERKNERTGDIWHTVLSLWGLEQANEFISIDPKVINEGLEYLESKQQQNGRYISGEGMEEDVKCTAFGLMVFLMDKNSRTQYNEVIRKGLVFLYETADDLEYSPISVLAAYALFLGKYEKADEHLKKLNSKASLTSKQMSWTKSDDLLSQLETTAGSLINLFESQEITEQSLLQIVRGLIVSKTEESSITPMVALQAMIEFLEKLLLGDTKLDISFEDDQHKSGDFKINSENSQVFQTFEVSQNSRKINIQSKGHGFAVVDVRYNYKVFSENETSSLFTTNISSRKISKHFGTMKICLNSPEKNTQNKLYTMEVNIVSGFVFTEKDFKGNSELKSTQINNSRDKAVVYFELNSATATDETCFEKEIRKNYKVLNSKPGWLVVYSAKNKDQRSTKHFMIDDF